MGKIKSNKSGIIHAYAQCNDCDWDSAIHIDECDRMSKLRTRINAHIKKTGHSITLETGNSTTYYLDKE